eukprot:Rmarinus@m.8664
MSVVGSWIFPRKKLEEDEPRVTYVQDEASNEQFKFCDNSINTAKFNAVSFLPISIAVQFRRIANFYFLIISILMILGSYTSLFESPLSPFSTFFTLCIVLLLTSAKEGMEDLKRHKSDREINNRIALVVTKDGKEVKTRWMDVKVGSVVKIRDREQLPVDCVLLKSSNEGGITYVETSNLDGETNLKLRTVPLQLQELSSEAYTWEGRLDCEAPNRRIHNFEGTLTLKALEKPVSLGLSNFLLRGCQLRNTNHVYGLVVFTGVDTKIMRNARATRSKLSNIEKTVNSSILYIFGTQAALVTISMLAEVLEDSDPHWYLLNSETLSTLPDWLASWFTFLILYNNFVPISLYVTMEMVNYIHAVFVDEDELMYDSESDTYARCRTSNLCQELGQIEYLFSDKTGTLTRNVMEFRRSSINGVIYGEPLGTGSQEFTGSDLLRDLHAGGDQAQSVRDFVLNLAVCHTVVAEKSEQDPGTLVYQAESPDEGALVKAAMKLGFEFRLRTPKGVMVRHDGEEREYEVLATNEFNSTRKRMSVLVRTPDNEYVLFCKGADNIMLARSDTKSRATLERHLSEFAGEGLRTLVLAQRSLSKSEALTWLEKFDAAKVALNNREQELMDAAEDIEKGMVIVGATAIEDRLQEGVPDTIADLGRAGVKVWVLTGDKEETAINIGYSCKLLLDESKLIKITDIDQDKVKGQIYRLLNHFNKLTKRTGRFGFLHKIMGGRRTSGSDYQQNGDLDAVHLEMLETDHLALIVDGAALTTILDDTRMKADFLRLACLCKVVVACRVSPAQKALIVRMVKKGINPMPMTLAIGDGANDVGMIQEAQVGVGISGKEGMQAVNASDFAIAQFRFLKRLLLTHGRWNYKRMSKVVRYSFYKNIVITLTLFYYSGFTLFSGTSLYESLVYAGFNFFLGLPIIAVGIFDQDVSSSTAEEYPQMYHSAKEQKYLNPRKMLIEIGMALLHSFVIMFFPYFAEDQTLGVLSFGLVVYSVMITSLTLKCMAETLTYTWVCWFFIIGSVLFYFFFITVYNVMPDITLEFYYVAFETFKVPRFWILTFTVPLICLIPDITYRYVKNMYAPSPNKIAMEIDRGYGARVSDVELSPVDTEEGRASIMDVVAHRQSESSLRKSRVCLSDLNKLMSDVTEEDRKAMGIEDMAGSFRSSYAFSHAERSTGYAAFSGKQDAENSFSESDE